MATYTCSDLHGMLAIWEAMLDKLNPDDKIIVLGDCGDRGPKSWETLKAVLEEPRATLLKGNHEDMLCDALDGYIRKRKPVQFAYNLLCCNGGEETFNGIIKDSKLEQYYNKLLHLDTIKEYVNQQGKRIVLSHAGFTPWKQSHDFEYRIPQDKDLLWNRDHFLDNWDQKECVDCYIIHGHTPIPYLLDQIDPKGMISEITPGPLWYDNKRKCCIDCGAVFTGYGVLLNLDTLESEVFSCERN